MNRYQEALHFLSIDEDCNDTECKKCSIKKICRKYSAINILQEAVDKANKYEEKETPKKVVHEYMQHPTIDCDQLFDYYSCPNCSINLDHKRSYCEDCGQALDWSDE